MSTGQCKTELRRIQETYQDLFKLITSDRDFDRINMDNCEMHPPFENGDIEFIRTLEKALSQGHQAALSAFGTSHVNVLTAKSGTRIF